MKYKIEKNTVKETLIIPLYARYQCSKLYPQLFYDQMAMDLIEHIDYDFSELEKKAKSTMQQFGFLEVAMRQKDLMIEVEDYLKEHPKAAVVNLGCGLDNTGQNVDNGSCIIYNLDFKEVIDVRNELLPAKDREFNIACDLNDLSWFDQIDATNGVVFFAAGVFYYFLEDDVKTLVCAMAKRFKGGKLVFDGAGKTAVKLMLKTWIKDAKIKDVSAYFAVNDIKKEIEPWDINIKVSSKGYMLGDHLLDTVKIKLLYRLLSKVGDQLMKMQIVRINF